MFHLTALRAPVVATDAHFVLYLGQNSGNTIIKLVFLVNANTVLTKTLTSAISVKEYLISCSKQPS